MSEVPTQVLSDKRPHDLVPNEPRGGDEATGQGRVPLKKLHAAAHGVRNSQTSEPAGDLPTDHISSEKAQFLNTETHCRNTQMLMKL